MDNFFNNLKNNNSDFPNTISNTNKRVWEAQQQQQGISNPVGLLNSYQHRSANGLNKKMENPDSQNINECYAKSVPYDQQYYYKCKHVNGMENLSKNLPNSNSFKTISPVSTFGHDKVSICKASQMKNIKECANLPNSNLFKTNANKSDRENCANGMRLEKNMKHLSKNLPNSNLFKTISPVSTYQRNFSNGHNNENHGNLNSHQNKIYSNDNHNPIGCSSVNRNSKKKQKNPKSQIKSSDGKCVACKDYPCYSDKTFWICKKCRHCLDIQNIVKLANSVGYEDPWCCPVCKEKETYFTSKTLTYSLYLY